jgi:hypothetical protein
MLEDLSVRLVPTQGFTVTGQIFDPRYARWQFRFFDEHIRIPFAADAEAWSAARADEKITFQA